MTETIFFRLLDSEDKGTALRQAIAIVPQSTTSEAFTVNPESFEQVPGAPFSYWVSERIRKSFEDLESFEGKIRNAKQGLATADDFRFIRTVWEYNLSQSEISRFVPFAKGGSFSRYYADIYLSVNWQDSGKEIAAFPKAYIRNSDYYFRPGLTWSLRSQKGLSVRLMPSNCAFGHKGPSIFILDNDLQTILALLAIANSTAFHLLIELQMAFGSYEVGVIQRTPIPDLTSESTTILANLAHRAWSLKRNLDTITQTSHAFILPALLQVQGVSLSERAQDWAATVATTEQALAQIQAEIDAFAFELYDISPEEVGSAQQTVADEAAIDTDEDQDTGERTNFPSLIHGLIENAFGIALGRFDLRLATGERQHPPEPEPFDLLPACSPGMLVADNDLPPTSAAELPTNYPIPIPFNGILVDDEGHPSDIISHVRQVLDLIWGDQAGDIEQEACQILKVSNLRDYFTKPTTFFAEHLSYYSKSRRQAPIYWPLSTPSGSYTLWLYYHRLTDQTLYTCINDYVEPKLHQIRQNSTQLRTKPDRTSTENSELETFQDLEQDLTEFRDELLRIAQLPWKPNLNDGVQITAAPLWKLFRLKKWQTKLKDTWAKLEKGDYDWAHLAYSIWLDRVREKCKQDKSLAVAHTLEDLYEELPEKPKKQRKRSSKSS